MRLYRPVGLKELGLIRAACFRGFPSRLPDQPFFYPVLNFDYAEQIARDWNAKDSFSGHVGFVTEFDVGDAFASRYERRVVGSAVHEELWVPAAELDEFNAHLEGLIRVVAHYAGDAFRGTIDPETHLPAETVG